MKKDNLSIIGIVVGIVMLLYGMLGPGTSLMAFVDVKSFVIVIVGSFAALLVSFSMNEIKAIGSYMNVVLRDTNRDKIAFIVQIINLSKKARKEGMLSLEGEIENMDDAFLKQGIKLIVDGAEEDAIVNILESEMENYEERMKQGIKFFKQWGAYAPAFGMIGTLIGLIQLLGNMEDINKLVAGMATALITTLYGAIAANLIMLPLADKISLNAGKVMDFIMLEYKAIRCVRSGYTPKMIQEILSTYLEESEKIKLEENIKSNK
ncbi:motility protein A [Candidatus Arthromitus sp. SFB-rat-Yit]|uniref:motility protein A n=1 Tax=Candidatus Arthromitus sp. SFB-rat-Yit TaxID=1041504 RepID=UPI000227A410|nr:MotA/TolQ/ExbB proton channel family protein [Candidatus Arthromitus sp. SFB-rat-Yit]BAK81520.1 chemotaxis MotA protein [Candidatus Arthromitus sp. SFB-rat-Yit]